VRLAEIGADVDARVGRVALNQGLERLGEERVIVSEQDAHDALRVAWLYNSP